MVFVGQVAHIEPFIQYQLNPEPWRESDGQEVPGGYDWTRGDRIYRQRLPGEKRNTEHEFLQVRARLPAPKGCRGRRIRYHTEEKFGMWHSVPNKERKRDWEGGKVLYFSQFWREGGGRRCKKNCGKACGERSVAASRSAQAERVQGCLVVPSQHVHAREDGVGSLPIQRVLSLLYELVSLSTG